VEQRLGRAPQEAQTLVLLGMDARLTDKPVLGVVPLTRQAWDELVSCLEEKLAQAKAGNISAFAYVIEYANGDVGNHAYHNMGSNVYKMVGAIEALKIRVCNRHLQPGTGEHLD
jgi:hypothetical protein